MKPERAREGEKASREKGAFEVPETSFAIDGRDIGQGHPAYVIAEVGINHNGDPETAGKLIRAAKDAGADAIKLQTYITEKRVPKDSPIFNLLKKCELSFEQQKGLFGLGREIGVTVFSTPFDEESVGFLNEIKSPALKVASFDIVNERLLKDISLTGLPVVLSRGMASVKEIEHALGILKEGGCPYALLHCVSAYPVRDLTDLNLSTVSFLSERFGCVSGFSDHTIGVEAAAWAVLSGAKIIEKHFTLDVGQDGPDHAMSADPGTLKTMIREIRKMEGILGRPVTGPIGAEDDILPFRRRTKA